MKITFVLPPPDLGGGMRVIATYAERLRQRGHNVVVFATPKPAPTPRDILRSLVRGQGWPSKPGIRASHFDHTQVKCHILDRHRPIRNEDLPDADIVIATWWETAEWVAALAPSKGIKVHLLQGHEVFDHLPAKRVESSWRLPFHKIVVAGWLADLAKDRYGDPNASLVPNAVDHELFHAPPRGKNATPTVGFMYSRASFKGCDIILEALAHCIKRLPGLRVVSFGDSPIASDLPMPTGACYTVSPPQQEIRTIYAECDAWLFGSRSEGFGLPILEAMACRTPVIGCPAGAAPELLADGGGFLVRPEDPKDMAEAIIRLCNLPDPDWRAMSDVAHATASRYTWNNATDRFEEALLFAIEKAASGQSMVHSANNY